MASKSSSRQRSEEKPKRNASCSSSSTSSKSLAKGEPTEKSGSKSQNSVLKAEISKNAELIKRIFEKNKDDPNDWTNCQAIRLEGIKSAMSETDSYDPSSSSSSGRPAASPDNTRTKQDKSKTGKQGESTTGGGVRSCDKSYTTKSNKSSSIDQKSQKSNLGGGKSGKISSSISGKSISSTKSFASSISSDTGSSISSTVSSKSSQSRTK